VTGHDEPTAREQARIRRRDRAASAKHRRGMRSGLAKGFKQILDLHLRRAKELRDDDSGESPAKD
jgi:hypothetical protein